MHKNTAYLFMVYQKWDAYSRFISFITYLQMHDAVCKFSFGTLVIEML